MSSLSLALRRASMLWRGSTEATSRSASRLSAAAAAATSASAPPPGSSRRAYHQNIVDHYESPRNVGALDKGDRSVGTGLVGAPACGDVMKLQIRVGADGRIAEAKFKTFGCGSAIASSSVATEWVKGRTVEEVLSIRNTDIAAHLKLPPVKLHWCVAWCGAGAGAGAGVAVAPSRAHAHAAARARVT